MNLVRLKKRAEFVAVSKAGNVMHTPYFVVQYLWREQDSAEPSSGIRVGFTVSRKVGDAVIRNRIKRRLREVTRLFAKAYPKAINAPLDIVLISRSAAIGASFSELQSSFIQSISKLIPLNSQS